MSKGHITTGRVAENRRARHEYEIEDTIETGLILRGSEVKSLRTGRASDVPRHRIAPPQWIGGCSGCICALMAEWMPSAPISRRPVTSSGPSPVSSVTATRPSSRVRYAVARALSRMEASPARSRKRW